jgi:transposase
VPQLIAQVNNITSFVSKMADIYLIHLFQKLLFHVLCGGSKIAKNQKIRKKSRTLSSSPTCSLSLLYSPWTFMVYCTISLDLKERALYLLLKEGWEMDQITTALGVHSTGIERWDVNYETHGCVNPPTPLQGCRQLLSSNIAEELHKLLIENPSLLSDEIGEWLAIYHDQPISMTALHDNLKDLGLTSKGLKRIATERDNTFRANWLHDMTSNYTADQLVFLDKSSKDDHAILHRYGWAI